MAAAWAAAPRKHSAQARGSRAEGISRAQRGNNGSPKGETCAARFDAQRDSAPGHRRDAQTAEVPESRSNNVAWGTDTPSKVK